MSSLEQFRDYCRKMAGPPVLREHRWPSNHSGEDDPYRCEHYAATPPLDQPSDPAAKEAGR